MSAAIAVLLCFLVYAIGYRFYAGFIARRALALRADAPTPAHTLEDGVDYVPTHRFVLFGHHYASITGLSPMLGPAIAVIWGWLPAMLWVVLGAVLIGCVHDFHGGAKNVALRGIGACFSSSWSALIRVLWVTPDLSACGHPQYAFFKRCRTNGPTALSSHSRS